MKSQCAKIKICLGSLILLIFIVLTFNLLYVNSVKAAPTPFVAGSGSMTVSFSDPGNTPFKAGDIDKTVNRIFDVVILISEVAFIILLLVGGIMYLTSMGDEETSKKAKKLMVDAVIGMVLVLAAWAIGTWVITQLKAT